jgi:hypothetical protein
LKYKINFGGSSDCYHTLIFNFSCQIHRVFMQISRFFVFFFLPPTLFYSSTLKPAKKRGKRKKERKAKAITAAASATKSICQNEGASGESSEG